MKKKQDEIRLWDAIWENKHDTGIIPVQKLIDKLNIHQKRAEFILQKWLGKCLINCGITIWKPWIEKGVKKEDLKLGKPKQIKMGGSRW